MMDGDIWVESEVGIGSTFFFTAKINVADKAQYSQYKNSFEKWGMKVLVVDDKEDSREIIGSMLADMSIDVTMSTSGEEAIAILEKTKEENRYDLVIMDWKMPEMDGIEASKRIKALFASDKAPAIILLTAYSSEGVQEKAEQIGLLEAVLYKPVTPSLLFNAIIHDDTVDRTTDGTGTVSQLKYSYIAALDAGVKKSSKFAGIRIPKFTDYLDAVKGAKQIYPEIKTYRTTEDIAVFTQTLLDKGFEQKATIQSFAYPITLPEIRKLSRKIRVGALCSDQAQFDENLIIAKKDPNSMMLISTKIATAENLTACKNANLPVAVWTVNTQDQLKDLLALGYDKLMLSQYMEYK